MIHPSKEDYTFVLKLTPKKHSECEFECEDIFLLHTQTRTHSGLSCG